MAKVRLDIEPRYRDLLHQDAEFLLRPKTGLNDMVVEIDPGTTGPPPEEGSTLPLAQGLSNVQLDQFWASLDRETQDYLVLLLNGAGIGLDGKGRELSQALRRFGPFATYTARINGLLEKRRENISGGVRALSLLATELGNNDQAVADFVTSTTHKTLRGPRGGIAMCRAAHAKDLDRSVFPGTQGGPLMHVIAGKAVAFAEALKPEFKAYGQRVIDNARALAAALASGGVRLVSGGTDNHLMLVDVTPLEIGGKLAEETLDRCGITCNKNMIPYDERKPMDPSGIRLGTPALTTRGMGGDEMARIAEWILRALRSPDDAGVLDTIRAEVADMAEQFPVPAARLEQAVAG